MAYRDISGQRFTRLVAEKYVGNGKWLCKCDCGNKTTVTSRDLITQHTRSCGCLHVDMARAARRVELAGQRFGRLTVLKSVGKDKYNKIHWECVCDCGNIVTPDTHSLICGNSKSCGCYMRDRAREANTTHGLTYTVEYNKNRCNKRREQHLMVDFAWTLEMEETLRILFPSCCLCGLNNDQHMNLYKERLHVDHVKPLSAGHGLRPGNAVLLCRKCNASKSSKSLEQLPTQDSIKLRCDSLLFKRVWEARRV